MSAVPLPRRSPASVGIDPAGIDGLVDAFDRLGGIHSFVLARGGEVVAEGAWAPWKLHVAQSVYSISKSFTSTAVGLAIAAGAFTLESRVVDVLADDVPSDADPALGEVRVRDLLTMTPGHAGESLPRPVRAERSDWLRSVLEQPLLYDPGEHFAYNSGASYALSAIVQRTTGQRMDRWLEDRLFRPLGFGPHPWLTSPEGIITGGWGLSTTAEDIAKLGILYASGGIWRGERLLPESWTRQATSWQVDNGDPDSASDWAQGYGLHFWRCRHGAWRGDGAFGQFLLVLPETEVVLAVTGGREDMQAELDVVWDRLLPTIHERSGAAGGSESSATYSRETPSADTTSGRTLRARGEGVSVSVSEAQVELVIDGVARTLPVSPDAWREARVAHIYEGSDVAMVRGGWVDDRLLDLRVAFVETPFEATVTVELDDTDRSTLSVDLNASFTDFAPIRRALTVESDGPVTRA